MIMRRLLLSLLFLSNLAFAASIPVIDMQDLRSPATRQRFIDGLNDAFRTVGFVAVINTDVDQKVLDSAYKTIDKFFKLPLEQKMYTNAPTLRGQRGYVQSEIAQGQKAKDCKEFYHIHREYPKPILNRHGYEPNIWPQDPKFRAELLKLMTSLSKYQQDFEQALAESIGQPKDFFTKMTAEGDCLLRAIHYPANPPKDTVWAAAHTDIDLYTILPRATAKGLQVKNDKGEWIDVVVPDNSFIINAGDFLQNLTNGVYKSSVHRVISSDSNVERYSIVYFIHPKPQDKMDPLPNYVAEVGSQKFPNATQKQLLHERLVELGLASPTA